jgi:hypothetical protein
MHWWIQGRRIPSLCASLMLVVLTACGGGGAEAVFRTQALAAQVSVTAAAMVRASQRPVLRRVRPRPMCWIR